MYIAYGVFLADINYKQNIINILNYENDYHGGVEIEYSFYNTIFAVYCCVVFVDNGNVNILA